MASTALAVATVGEEPLAIAHGASSDVVDPILAHAGAQELRVDHGAQIDVGAIAFAGAQDIGIGGRVAELGGDVVADLEAAGFDVGADRSHGVEGRAGEAFEGMECDGGDIEEGSTPAAVHGSDGAGAQVADEDGGAVGEADGACDIGVAGEDGIAGAASDGGGIVGMVDDVAIDAVDLVEEHEVVGVAAQVGGGAGEVGGDVGCPVPDGHGEIQ